MTWNLNSFSWLAPYLIQEKRLGGNASWLQGLNDLQSVTVVLPLMNLIQNSSLRIQAVGARRGGRLHSQDNKTVTVTTSIPKISDIDLDNRETYLPANHTMGWHTNGAKILERRHNFYNKFYLWSGFAIQNCIPLNTLISLVIMLILLTVQVIFSPQRQYIISTKLFRHSIGDMPGK